MTPEAEKRLKETREYHRGHNAPECDACFVLAELDRANEWKESALQVLNEIGVAQQAHGIVGETVADTMARLARERSVPKSLGLLLGDRRMQEGLTENEVLHEVLRDVRGKCTPMDALGLVRWRKTRDRVEELEAALEGHASFVVGERAQLADRDAQCAAMREALELSCRPVCRGCKYLAPESGAMGHAPDCKVAAALATDAGKAVLEQTEMLKSQLRYAHEENLAAQVRLQEKMAAAIMRAEKAERALVEQARRYSGLDPALRSQAIAETKERCAKVLEARPTNGDSYSDEMAAIIRALGET